MPVVPLRSNIVVGLAFAMCCFASTLARAANQYVVLSTEPAEVVVPTGKVFNVGDTIDIPAGLIVTLLGDDGSINTVSGPANLLVTQDPLGEAEQSANRQTTFGKVISLLLDGKTETTVLGAARSIGTPKGMDVKSLDWAVSMDVPGPACARDNSIILSRGATFELAVISADGSEGGVLGRMMWQGNQAFIKLPSEFLAVASEITVDMGTIRRSFHIMRLPAAINSDQSQAVLGWMLEKGCASQAINYARRLAKREK